MAIMRPPGGYQAATRRPPGGHQVATMQTPGGHRRSPGGHQGATRRGHYATTRRPPGATRRGHYATTRRPTGGQQGATRRPTGGHQTASRRLQNMNSYSETEKMRKKEPQRKIIVKLSMAVGNNILSINVCSYSVFSLNICGNKCSFIIYLLFIYQEAANRRPPDGHQAATSGHQATTRWQPGGHQANKRCMKAVINLMLLSF